MNGTRVNESFPGAAATPGPPPGGLRAFSVRAKLIAMVMVTTLVALALAGGALALFEFRSHRRTLADELTTVAQMMGQILPAALVLRRVDTATQALRTLDSHRDVVSACLYYESGALFAWYSRRGDAHPDCPRREVATGVRTEFVGDTLVLTRTIGSEDTAATLRIVASMGEVQRRMRLFGLVLLVVLTGAALAALLLSSGLQRLVSGPIHELANTAQQIARNNDYTLRAPQRTHDEVGAAVDAFNQMLDRIEAAVRERAHAEAALLALNSTLEERVADRTAAAEQKAAELKRSNEELERFASVASHDLQEPLRAVASYTQLLKARLEEQPLDEELQSYLDYVIAGVGRMKVLINDLLNYSRVGRTLSRTTVEVEQVLKAALADLNTAISESSAVIEHGPLPRVWANPGQLGQVFTNLVLNAIRFRSDAPPRIHVSAEPKGDFWQIAVRDNGIGIEPKHHERIFVIFQRLHGRDRPGTGIGLAICRKIVELHGGRIWVESAPGAGSTFYFTMPARGE